MEPLPDSEPYRLPEPACLIRRVQIRNYKSIRHVDVSLSPFTILVGRNRPLSRGTSTSLATNASLARERSPSFDKLCRELEKRLA